MKKSFTLLLLSASILCNAQQPTAADESRFTFGTKGGFGGSRLTPHDNAFNGSWFIGLASAYHFSDRMAIGAEALYSSEGATIRNEVNSTLQLDYFRIPVKLAYYFNGLSSDLRPKVSVGPNFGFRMADPDDTAAGFEGSDIGMNLTAGMDYRVLEGFWLTTEVDYYNGFTDVYRHNTVKDHNRNLRLDIGLMVNF